MILKYFSEVFKKQGAYRTGNSEALVKLKCICTTMGYTVLIMKERECGIGWIDLLAGRVVPRSSQIFKNGMADELKCVNAIVLTAFYVCCNRFRITCAFIFMIIYIDHTGH